MSTQLATLPSIALARQVEPAQWNALKEIYDGASDEKIALVIDYCCARKLDPLKKPVHIVQTWSARRNCMVETLWPSIAEVRITAMRTGNYVGVNETEFGPTITRRVGTVEVTFPEWARITVYRTVKIGMEIKSVAFVGPKVLWIETYSGRGKDPTPNAMWAKRSVGQLEKCAEAAALRKAFPEELGSQYTAEEMHGRTVDIDDANDDANDDATTTEGTATERSAPPPRNRRGGAADAKASIATEPAPAPKADVKADAASKFAGPTDAEIVGETPKDDDAAAKAERDQIRAKELARQNAEAEAKAKAEAAADAAAAQKVITPEITPEVCPGVSLEGYHGKTWPHTITGIPSEAVARGNATKSYATFKLKTERGEVLSLTTTQGVAIVDGKPMITLGCLTGNQPIDVVVKAKLYQQKDAATGKLITGTVDYARAPALMAEHITESVDESPV